MRWHALVQGVQPISPYMLCISPAISPARLKVLSLTYDMKLTPVSRHPIYICVLILVHMCPHTPNIRHETAICLTLCIFFSCVYPSLLLLFHTLTTPPPPPLSRSTPPNTRLLPLCRLPCPTSYFICIFSFFFLKKNVDTKQDLAVAKAMLELALVAATV